MLRWMQTRSLRTAVRTGFLCSGGCFVAAAALSAWPWASIALLLLGAYFLVLLDICGGLPFLMSVKPSERNEMSAVYSTFRDVANIITQASSGSCFRSGRWPRSSRRAHRAAGPGWWPGACILSWACQQASGC
jgi:hypothetical protein